MRKTASQPVALFFSAAMLCICTTSLLAQDSVNVPAPSTNAVGSNAIASVMEDAAEEISLPAVGTDVVEDGVEDISLPAVSSNVV